MTDTAPQTMSKSEFAKHLGNSPSYVTKLRKDGRLVFAEDGKKVMVEASMQRIEATKDPNRDDVAARHAANRNQTASAGKDQPVPDPQPVPDKVSQSYSNSRAVKERYAALTAKTEFEKLTGQLCETDEVKTAGDELGLILRSALEILPDQLAPQLAPISDETRVYALMAEHIENVLAEIARRIEGIVKTMTKVEEG